MNSLTMDLEKLQKAAEQRMQLAFRKLSSAFKSSWLWLIVVGYLLRIVLMPITGQHDVMFMPWQAHFIGKGHLNVYAYLHGRFGDIVMTRPAVWAPYPYGFYAFTSLWLTLIERVDLIELTNWRFIWEVVHPARTVFLFKLAYLPFDVAIGYLLYLSGRGSRSRVSWLLWAWSPTAIYTPFMMGQNDIYATAFMTAGLYSAACSIRSSACFSNCRSHRWESLSVLLLGIGATFKIFPLLLIPGVSLVLTDRWNKRLGLTFLGCLPFALIALPFLTTPSFLNGVLLNPEGMRLFQTSSLFGFPASLFLVSYLSLLMVVSTKPALTAPATVWSVGLILLTLVFVFVPTPFYWLIWITPLIIAATAHTEPRLFAVWVVMQVGFSILLLTKHRELGVALPVHLSGEFNVPSLLTAMSIIHPILQRGLGHIELLANSATVGALVIAVWRSAAALRQRQNSSLIFDSLKRILPAILLPVTVMFLGLALNLYVARNMVSPSSWSEGEDRLTLSPGDQTILQTFTSEFASATGVRLRILDSSDPNAYLQVCLIKEDAPDARQLHCSSKSISQQAENRVIYYMFDRNIRLEPDQPYSVRVHLETSDAIVTLPYSAQDSDTNVQFGDTAMTGAIGISMLRPFSIRRALRTLILRNIGGDLCLLVLIIVTGLTSTLLIAALHARQRTPEQEPTDLVRYLERVP